MILIVIRIHNGSEDDLFAITDALDGLAFCFALARTGSSNPARMAMMANHDQQLDQRKSTAVTRQKSPARCRI